MAMIFGFLLLAVLCSASLAFHNGMPRRPSRVVLHDFLDDSKSALEGIVGDVKDVKIDLPDLTTMDLPEIPDLDIPSVSIPSIDLKSIDISSVSNLSGDLPLEVIGLSIAAIVLLFLGGGGKESTSRQRGVSSSRSLTTVPYDAAAQMAYGEWIAEHENEKVNAAAYAHFKKLYEAKAIADATSKKLSRDLANFKNEAPPVTKRQIAPQVEPPKKNLDPMYFARK